MLHAFECRVKFGNFTFLANNVVFQSTNKGDIDTLTQNVITLFGSEFLKTLSVDDITLDKVYKTVQCNDINIVEYLSNVSIYVHTYKV